MDLQYCKWKLAAFALPMIPAIGASAHYAAHGPQNAASALIPVLAGLFGSFVPELFGSDLKRYLAEQSNPKDILENEHLTRAVGRAIGAVLDQCADLAEVSSDKDKVRAMAAYARDRWNDVYLRHRPEYSELESFQLTEYFAKNPGEIRSTTALTPSEWNELLRFDGWEYGPRKKAFAGNELQAHTLALLSEKLHREFASALFEVLSSDATHDGAAFSKLLLLILGQLMTASEETKATGQRLLEFSRESLADTTEILLLLDQLPSAIDRRLLLTEQRIIDTEQRIIDCLEAGRSTVESLLEEADKAAEQGRFDETLLLTERAVKLAEQSSNATHLWRSSILAARAIFDVLTNTRRNARDIQKLLDLANSYLASSASAGAPRSKVALTRALLATFEREHATIEQVFQEIRIDETASHDEKGEATILFIQSLVNHRKPENALEYWRDVYELTKTDNEEIRLLLEATWLRVLCQTGIACDQDVDTFVASLMSGVTVEPQVRLHNLALVVREFSEIAQHGDKNSNPAELLMTLASIERLSQEGLSELESVVQSLSNLQRMTDFETQLNQLGFNCDAKSNSVQIKTLQDRLQILVESELPNLGDRKQQTLRLLEVAWYIATESENAAVATNASLEIAEFAAMMGDEARVTQYLAEAERWCDATKSAVSTDASLVWHSARANMLGSKGRTLYRLGLLQVSYGKPDHKIFESAMQTLKDAVTFARNNQHLIKGHIEMFVAQSSFFLGETQAQLGLDEDAAKSFEAARSPLAMCKKSYRDELGFLAWLKQAECMCFSGDVRGSQEVVKELIAHSETSIEMGGKARSFESFLEEHVFSFTSWLGEENASRIGRVAKSHGLNKALAQQTELLFEWHENFFKDPLNPGYGMAQAYDFWGRGGFARVVAAIRGAPEGAIAVDAYTIPQVEQLARILCPIFPTVVVKWKGQMGDGFMIDGYADPAPDGDEHGDFFGGMGLIRCRDGLIGSGHYLPFEVGAFIAGAAASLVRQGRLVILPAPFVGCTQSSVGWTDDLLTRCLLRGVASGVAYEPDPDQLGDFFPLKTPIPFIDGVSLQDLATVLDDLAEQLIDFRAFVAELPTETALKRTASVNKVEALLRDASRKFEEVLHRSIPAAEASKWHVSHTDGGAGLARCQGVRMGSEPNTDILKAISKDEPDIGKWAPFWCLTGLQGHLDWSHRLDNVSKPPVLTPYGEIRHTWLYPGTGGPGLAAAWKFD